MIVFRSNKVRQHLGITPARRAGGGPVIEVPGMTAEIDHAVDGTGAAQAAAAWLGKKAAVKMILRRSHKAPVKRCRANGGAGRGRHVNKGMFIPWPRLYQADPIFRVKRQTVGQYASCRPGPDYDKIETVLHILKFSALHDTGIKQKERGNPADPPVRKKY